MARRSLLAPQVGRLTYGVCGVCYDGGVPRQRVGESDEDYRVRNATYHRERRARLSPRVSSVDTEDSSSDQPIRVHRRARAAPLPEPIGPDPGEPETPPPDTLTTVPTSLEELCAAGLRSAAAFVVNPHDSRDLLAAARAMERFYVIARDHSDRAATLEAVRAELNRAMPALLAMIPEDRAEAAAELLAPLERHIEPGN